MKKLIGLTLIALFAGSVAMAQQNKGVDFLTAPFKEVAAAADKAGKPIFMDVYAVWCGPCKYMSNTIFPTAEAGNYFNKNFVNAKVDAEKGEGIEIARRYNVRAYPTFLILDKNGKELGRVVGGAETAQDFIARVETLMKTIK